MKSVKWICLVFLMIGVIFFWGNPLFHKKEYSPVYEILLENSSIELKSFHPENSVMIHNEIDREYRKEDPRLLVLQMNGKSYLINLMKRNVKLYEMIPDGIDSTKLNEIKMGSVANFPN